MPRGGTRLAALLAGRGITQLELSLKADVSRQTLSNAHNGTRPVSLESWVRIAEALGVSIDEIAPADVAARIAAVA